MWLKKGYNYLVEHNKCTDLGAGVKLGVGKKKWVNQLDFV